MRRKSSRAFAFFAGLMVLAALLATAPDGLHRHIPLRFFLFPI